MTVGVTQAALAAGPLMPRQTIDPPAKMRSTGHKLHRLMVTIDIDWSSSHTPARKNSKPVTWCPGPGP